MEQVLGGLQILMTWQNFLVIPIGLIIGIVVGAIPGLTSDLGIILCIPLTYGMDPTMAILMLLAIYCGGTYGGSITAILINTPGTTANAATLCDGDPMTVKGQAFKSLHFRHGPVPLRPEEADGGNRPDHRPDRHVCHFRGPHQVQI